MSYATRPLLAQTLDSERALLVNINADLSNGEGSLADALRLAKSIAKEGHAPIFVGVPLSKPAAALLWKSVEERSAETLARWFFDREQRERRRRRRRATQTKRKPRANTRGNAA